MIARLAAVLLVVAGAACWGTRDSYQCDADSDCNLGTAGRCEVNARCTVFDPACETGRRYTDHSEELSGQCFTDNREPLDACAPGQAPATPTGCYADVCAAAPSCCTTAWSEACVLEAQMRCPALTCETHVAITANRGANIELWRLAWQSNTWTSPPVTGAETLLLWLAPAPGTATPRLADIRNGRRTLVVDGTPYDIADRPYQWGASVDFDRDGRDTVAISSADTGVPSVIELVELQTNTRREITTAATQRITFADYDHDAYPDAFAFAGGNYQVLTSIADDGAPRELASTSTSSLPSGAANTTNGTSAVHGLELADVDRDHRLDLVAIGTTVRIHLAEPRIRDQPNLSIDCSPPVVGGSCDPTIAAFTSTVVPAAEGPATIYVGLYPQRTIYRSVVTGSPPVLSFQPIPVPCPGQTCPGFIGMFTRDIDGDHRLDVVAIDSDLAVVTLLGGKENAPIYGKPIPTTTTNFGAVKLSITGFMP